MPRWLFPSATVLSLLLFFASFGLWARSYRHCDVLVQPRKPGDRWCVTSEFGVVVVEYETAATPVGRAGWSYFLCSLPRRWPGHRRWGGFELYQGSNRHYIYLPTTPLVGVAVPWWFIVGCFAFPPVRVGLRHLRRRARGRQGLCRNCGYDLRASREKCPECGAVSG